MKYLSEPLKSKTVKRLKRIEGQVRGIQRMIEKDSYCIDVITQSSAVKQALSNLEDILLENHLSHCTIHQVLHGEADKAKEEIIHVYKLKRK